MVVDTHRSIDASVGRGGINQPSDVRLVQSLLNRFLTPQAEKLHIDGSIGPKTIAAIKEFQFAVVGNHHPDGRVDAGGKTLRYLSDTAKIHKVLTTRTRLPTPSKPTVLTGNDLKQAAKTLHCEVACIYAVADVESVGNGFLPSGRPKILFEAHIFSRFTHHRFDNINPRVSSASWDPSLYRGGEQEYERLKSAMILNRAAALKSTSWGRFQMMGFHYSSSGLGTLELFIQAMFESEAKQLEAFVHFLQHQRLDGDLRAKRWTAFAEHYNGPGYASNQYDQKLKAAYAKQHKKELRLK